MSPGYRNRWMVTRVWSTAMPLQRVLLFFLLCGLLVKGISAVKSKYACQGDKLRLRCEDPYVLRIYKAHYGRSEPGSSICPHRNISSLSCAAPNVLLKMTARCANKPRCAVRANTLVFGDPCPGTFKYLDVIYVCIPGDNWTPTPRITRTRSPKQGLNQTTLSTVKFSAWKTTQATSTRRTKTTLLTPLNGSTLTSNRSTPFKSTVTPLPGTGTFFPSSRGGGVNRLSTPTSLSPPKPQDTGYSGRRERSQQTLVVFLSAVAGVTAFLLMLLFSVHLCKKHRKKRKFSMQDSTLDEPEETAKQKTVTIEIQGSDDETKEINVNPGDIIIIDHNDVNRPGSEDLGYLSEIVRFYNSQNIGSDDQISIRKQSSTCDSPSVISTEPSESGRRDSKYDSGIKHCNCQNSADLRSPTLL